MRTTHEPSAEDLIRELTLLRGEVRKRYKADIRGIFGSFIRGEQRPDSDLDILVEFDAGANLLDLTGLSLFLEEKLRRHVDIVPESAIREELKDRILKKVAYL